MERDHNEDDEKDKDCRQSNLGRIPLDLLEAELLARLPGKSLMKFQCVSKMWSSIIQSQRFVESYYAMSSKMRSRFVIAFSNVGTFAEENNKRLFIFSSSYEREVSSSLVTNLEMTIPSVTLNYTSNCASIHGLIGFSKIDQFIVCNPSTGKVISFFEPRTYLGYDPVDAQFKALSVITSSLSNHDNCLVHEVITLGGGESSWIRNRVTTPRYCTVTSGICIDGFVYYGAWTPTRSRNPVIVCFDVRNERISFIKAPRDVVVWENGSILIEYRGKLASIVRNPYESFICFDLWILEDVKKHDWSKQTFELPFSLGQGMKMLSPGTNKAGEIIFAPRLLSRDVQPFYIFYYNVERKDMRKVMLQGIADDEAFRRRYGLVDKCLVCISPEHIESVASL